MFSAYIISRFGGNRGYRIIFVITLGLFVGLFLLILILKCKTYGPRLDFKRCLSKNSKEWGIIRKSTAIWGFRDVIIGFIINILIIQVTNSELSLGEVTLAASLTSSVSFWLVQRTIKPEGRKLSILIGTLGTFTAVLGIVFNLSFTALVFYSITDAFFLPFFIIQLSSSSFNVIDRANEEGMRIEYLVNKDYVLNFGRIISSVILLSLITFFKNSTVLKGYLLFLGLVPLISGYFLRRLTGVLKG